MTKKWLRNDQEWLGKYHYWLLMTDFTCSHLPLMNGWCRDFLKQSCPANLGYHPVLSWGHIFSRARPFCEWAVSDLDRSRSLTACSWKDRIRLKIRLRCTRLFASNTRRSLFCRNVSEEERKFYRTDTWPMIEGWTAWMVISSAFKFRRSTRLWNRKIPVEFKKDNAGYSTDS
jgi:hypothetical protein